MLNSKRIAAILATVVLAPLPALAANASVSTPLPASTINADTRISFNVITSGFQNPTFFIADSIPGGANKNYIDSNGNFAWSPNKDEVGTHNLTITVSDALGNSQTVTQSFTVMSGPTASIDSLSPGATVNVGTQVTFHMTTQGLIGSVSYRSLDYFPNTSVNFTRIDPAGNFSWVPIWQDAGTHTIILNATDGFGYTASTSQTIAVIPSATLKILTPTSGTITPVGTAVPIVATTTGFVNPNYSIVDSTLNASTTASIDSTGHGSWTPHSGEIGTRTFIVSASDSLGHSLSETFNLSVPVPGGGTTQSSGGSLPAVTPYTPGLQPTAQASYYSQGSYTPTPASGSQKNGYVFTRYLEIGASGTSVLKLQTALTSLGFYNGPITGYFGAKTKAGVVAYQNARGINPLGVVGPTTRTYLNKENW